MRELATAKSHALTILVPELVVGETFTKLRYDRRVGSRRSSKIALTAFEFIDRNPRLFSVVTLPANSYARARDILRRYADHAFSYVDAVTFLTVDDDPSIDTLLTVDGSDFSTYRFAHHVTVIAPAV